MTELQKKTIDDIAEAIMRHIPPNGVEMGDCFDAAIDAYSVMSARIEELMAERDKAKEAAKTWLNATADERLENKALINRVSELIQEGMMYYAKCKQLEAQAVLHEKQMDEFAERSEDDKVVLRARIAELEAPLCIGETTIRILAKEGAKVFENGQGLVAADELFKQDPYDRIAELEADLNDCIKIAEEHEGCEISHIEGMPCEAGEQIADIIRKKING